jgi:hypothetical protein
MNKGWKRLAFKFIDVMMLPFRLESEFNRGSGALTNLDTFDLVLIIDTTFYW